MFQSFCPPVSAVLLAVKLFALVYKRAAPVSTILVYLSVYYFQVARIQSNFLTQVVLKAPYQVKNNPFIHLPFQHFSL